MTTTEELEELDIITQMRGEVMSRKDITGDNLFLAWGYPTVLVLLLEFAGLMVWNEDWCAWLWAGIPLIGTPLMIYFLNEDYERTRRRTLRKRHSDDVGVHRLRLWWRRTCHGLCRRIPTGFLRLSWSALRHGLLHDGHRPALPSQDHLRHYRIPALCRSSLLLGQSLALAVADNSCHRHHCPHHSRTPI